MILGFARLAACLSPQRLQNRTPCHLNPRCRQTVVKNADRRFRLVRHYYVLPAKPRKNKEPTSGLEPLTSSHYEFAILGYRLVPRRPKKAINKPFPVSQEKP